MTQIDLGLDVIYANIKKKFNKINKRKFLYIGNDYSFNNYAKNLNYLRKISQFIGQDKFALLEIKALVK